MRPGRFLSHYEVPRATGSVEVTSRLDAGEVTQGGGDVNSPHPPDAVMSGPGQPMSEQKHSSRDMFAAVNIGDLA